MGRKGDIAPERQPAAQTGSEDPPQAQELSTGVGEQTSVTASARCSNPLTHTDLKIFTFVFKF